MNSTTSDKISAIIHSDKELEDTINELIAESVARSDISIQGNPEQLKEKFGESFIHPEKIQDSRNPPVTEAFLGDDFGWVVGFSFAIPLFVCLILGIFIIGDVRSTYDIILYGILGAIVGSIIGFFCSRAVKQHHDSKIKKQEKEGGYVLWVTTHSKEQHDQVLKILKKHHSGHIKD